MKNFLGALAILIACVSCTAFNGSLAGGTLFNNQQPVVCGGGAEAIDNACFCPSGQNWNGLTCQGKPNPENCTGGSYPFGPAGKVTCRCLVGYSLNNGQCTQLQCTGGSVAGDSECVCPDGSAWDGAQCVYPQALTCSGGAVILDGQCMCINGTMWDGNNCIVPPSAPGIVCSGGAFANGDQCYCPDNTTWDGANCVGQQAAQAPQDVQNVQSAPAVTPIRTCRTTLMEKGFGPSTLRECDGVNNRCAVALLDHGYGASAVHLCRGIEGACAEALFNKGYGPSTLNDCAVKGHGGKR